MFILATGITSNYYERAKQFLESVNKNSNVKNYCIYLSENGNERVKDKYDNIEFVYGKISDQYFPNKNNCLQHGEWVNFLKDYITDTDVVCFTDADIIMQTKFNEDFISNIEVMEDKEILTSYNAGEDDKLSDEYNRLGALRSLPEICSIIENKAGSDVRIVDTNCFNTGVVICNVKTWKMVYYIYTALYPLITTSFRHYAAQQWFLSLIFGYMFYPSVLDYTIHTHGHYALPKGVTIEDKKAYYNGTLITLAHHIEGVNI